MSLRIVEVVNAIRPESFLELGTFDGATFAKIECVRKCSVDTNGNGTFTGTTDEFFAQNTRCWDTVFVDADHRLRQVVKDWNNAIQVANRIFLHDMIPPSVEFTADCYCSDSYKLLNHFVTNGVECATLDHDCGLAVVHRKHFRHIEFDEIEQVTYEAFMERVKTVNLQEFIDYARG